MIQLSIANDFSKTPGVRYPEEGEFSGQQFREDFLKPKVDEANLARRTSQNCNLSTQ